MGINQKIGDLRHERGLDQSDTSSGEPDTRKHKHSLTVFWCCPVVGRPPPLLINFSLTRPLTP